MSFLADFEPALIHSPFDSQQRRQTGSNSTFNLYYKPSKKNPSTISPISSLAMQEIKKVNSTPSIKTTIPTGFSSTSLTEQVPYDRKYWTDKLVTFMLMMPPY